VARTPVRREPETPSSILNWVRDAEHDFGYRDLHGNWLDLDEREDRE
jgi:hypothetical protein